MKNPRYKLALYFLAGISVVVAASLDARALVIEVANTSTTISVGVDALGFANAISASAGNTFDLKKNLLISGSVSTSNTDPEIGGIYTAANSIDGKLGATDAFPFVDDASDTNLIFNDGARTTDRLTINLFTVSTITLVGGFQSAYNRTFVEPVTFTLWSGTNATGSSLATKTINTADPDFVDAGFALGLTTENAWRFAGYDFGGVSGVNSIEFTFTRFNSAEGSRIGEVVAVPEPGTAALVGLACLAGILFRKRWQSQA